MKPVRLAIGGMIFGTGALLVVVAVVAIIAAIAIPNMERRHKIESTPAQVADVNQEAQADINQTRMQIEQTRREIQAQVDQSLRESQAQIAKSRRDVQEQLAKMRSVAHEREAEALASSQANTRVVEHPTAAQMAAMERQASMNAAMEEIAARRARASHNAEGILIIILSVGVAIAMLSALIIARQRRGAGAGCTIRRDEPVLFDRLVGGLERMENRMDNLETIFDARRSPALHPLDAEFERLKGSRT